MGLRLRELASVRGITQPRPNLFDQNIFYPSAASAAAFALAVDGIGGDGGRRDEVADKGRRAVPRGALRKPR